MADLVDSVKTATNRNITVVTGLVEDYDAGSDTFVTDKAVTDTPTQTITLSAAGFNANAIKKFELTNIQRYFDSTNNVKYQFWLFQDAQADNTTSYGHIVFETPNSQADATRYIDTANGSRANGTLTAGNTLPVIVELTTPGTLYYAIDWGAAPGSVDGYIRVKGKLLK